VRRPVDHRPGVLETHLDVRQHVLDRLERSDRLSELLPLAGVLDGRLDQTLRDPELLRKLEALLGRVLSS